MEAMRLSYRAARSKIKDGDIVFVSKSDSLMNLLIRFFTHSKYTHVGIAFWIEVAGDQRLMIAEAHGGAHRRVLNMSFYEDDNIDIIQSPRDWNEYVSSALEHLGKIPYGYLEAGYVGLREFCLKHTGGWINLPHRNLPGEICSEYVARLIGMKNVHVSPQGLYEQLVEQRHKIHIKIR